jgi:hypothetical protein
VSLDCHPVGGAILLRDGTPDPEQTAFAAWLATDPDHTVVICDLAEEYPEQAWEPVVQALAATTGSLRLVPWRRRQWGLLPVGELLGRRLARIVVAADGHPVTAAAGGLFIPPDAGTGWYRVGPGRLPRRDSRRSPKPRWTDWAPLEDMAVLSPATTLHPLPSGAWLSPEGSVPAHGDHGARNHGAPDHSAPDHSRWLYANVGWSHDTISVVLGQPGAPPVPAADVAKLWSTLPIKARQRVQFVPYGTSAPSRQELADALGDRVTVAAPLGGMVGWASEPADASTTAQPATAGPVVSRPATVPAATVAGAMTQPAAAVTRPERQRLPPIRLESSHPGGARQRFSAAPPPREAVEYQEEPAPVLNDENETDGANPQLAARAEGAGTGFASVPGLVPTSSPAADPAPASVPLSPSGREILTPLSVLARVAPPAVERAAAADPAAASVPLSPSGREILTPLSVLARVAPPAVEHATAAAPVAVEPAVAAPRFATPVDAPPGGAAPTLATPVTAPPGNGAVRVQPVPARDASVVSLDGGLEEERQWLQTSLSRQFSATASSVARVLSQNPRLRGGGEQEAVVDLVAVRLYLTEYGQRIDDDVRTGQPGAHVPFARCVNAGLRRLPSHRGAVRHCAALSDAEWNWYGSQRLITEWAFCSALTDGAVPLPGNVDFLIWSATARRTSALAPEVPGQVVFLPGTRFKVLAVRDGERRAVLLREMSAVETAPGVAPGTDPAPLDQLALTGLGKANVAWAGMKRSTALPQEHAHRFGNPPGLIRRLAEILAT